MKRLRNILTGALLVLGALSPAVVQADSIPVTQDGLVAELDSMAQRDDVTPAEQEKNTVDCRWAGLYERNISAANPLPQCQQCSYGFRSDSR